MATTIGIFLAIAWPVGLIACAVWLLVALLFRYSSLAALIAVAAAPVAAWFLANHQTAGLALFLAVVVWLAPSREHRAAAARTGIAHPPGSVDGRRRAVSGRRARAAAAYPLRSARRHR